MSARDRGARRRLPPGADFMISGSGSLLHHPFSQNPTHYARANELLMIKKDAENYKKLEKEDGDEKFLHHSHVRAGPSRLLRFPANRPVCPPEQLEREGEDAAGHSGTHWISSRSFSVQEEYEKWSKDGEGAGAAGGGDGEPSGKP